VNPIEKVVQMLSDLEQKIIGEGKTTQKAYDEFAEWCDDRSKDLQFEIKTGKAQSEDLKATITAQTARIAAANSKVEDLSGDITSSEGDLVAATKLRAKESADFSASQKELNSIIDMLQRAIAILEKEMAGGASMMQLKSAANLEQALAVMVQASAMSSVDASKLTALVQSGSDDAEEGAPAAAEYASHSSGIVDTLNGLLDKAQAKLSADTQAETSARQKFQMLKQSLEDSIKFANKDMDDTKKSLAESGELKAGANGDLGATSQNLAEDVKALAELHSDCMTKAQDFEAETKSRGDELNALAEAKKVISESTTGATDQTYSFLQLSSKVEAKNFQIVRIVKDLARKNNAPELAQLASRLSSVIRLNHGDDVFSKVKALIADMIDRLEKSQSDATALKAWCDKEIAETNTKKEDAEALFDKLSTKIDSKSSRSKKLKDQIAALQKELASLAKTQAQMDSIRADEKAAFETNRPEMEAGLNGVKLALKILNEYYAKEDKAHSASAGGSSGIIGLLEVIESDFTKGLTEMVAAEQVAAATHERETKENAIEKASKMQDVKYKQKESVSLDKAVSDLSSDRELVSAELKASNDYSAQLDEKCTYKVESYAERAARRQSEISGLKDALDILESETALVQTGALRGVRKHM